MKASRITIVVRVPLESIGEEVRSAHSIEARLSSARLEGEDLILTFGGQESSPRNELDGPPAASPSEARPARRRRKALRNRMKTRGWNVVTKMINSKGQTVAIYEPFVTALRGQKLPRPEQRKRVLEILRANGNRPGPVSIDYYLANTLEFLKSEEGQ